MDARIAEGLVRKWQNIKSQAFGPAHSVDKLSEVKIHLVSVDEIPYLQINQGCIRRVFFISFISSSDLECQYILLYQSIDNTSSYFLYIIHEFDIKV